MSRMMTLSELLTLVGTEIGVSDWITVDQAMIDKFADATHDHQFIHTDPERARNESPFGGTIAHGFLSLSLLSVMNYEGTPQVREKQTGINYGFNRIRFISPVSSGSRVRGRFILKAMRFRGADMAMLTYGVTVEIENEPKPALTAEWLTICQFDPKNHPENLNAETKSDRQTLNLN